MSVVAGLAQLVYLTAAFVLAGHLLSRARRSRDLAPLLLGLQLLLAMGLGYLLCCAGMALALLAQAPPRALVFTLLATGYGATMAGLAAALLFEWRVFWPAARWPLALGGCFLAVMLAGWLGSAAGGAFATGSYRDPWFLLLNGGMLAVNLWVGIEPLVYHRKLRRRVRLGLAEPLIVDRFLLWGLGSLARALLVVVGPVSEWWFQRLDAETRLAVSAVELALVSLLGLAASLAYWLTFNPTTSYVRWVQRRYRDSGA